MQGPPCVPSGNFEFLLVQQYLWVTCSEFFFVFFHQILTHLCLLLFGLFVGLILFITLQQLHFLFTALRADLAWLLWNIPRKRLMIIRIHILVSHHECLTPIEFLLWARHWNAAYLIFYVHLDNCMIFFIIFNQVPQHIYLNSRCVVIVSLELIKILKHFMDTVTSCRNKTFHANLLEFDVQ